MWRQSANHSLSLRWAWKTAPWEFQIKLLHYFFTSNNKSNLHLRKRESGIFSFFPVFFFFLFFGFRRPIIHKLLFLLKKSQVWHLLTVLFCFIKPILGNQYSPSVSSRASQWKHTHVLEIIIDLPIGFPINNIIFLSLTHPRSEIADIPSHILTFFVI